MTSTANLFGQEPWERRGEAASTVATAISAALPVGVITAYWGTVAPTGWLLCNGAAIPAQYAALIALVGANTPDLKGRVIVGIDAAQAEFDILGETGGVKTHTLTVAEMPDHGHDFYGVDTNGSVPGGVGNRFFGAVGAGAVGNLVGLAGGGAAHNNLQPYAVLSYIIRAG